MAKELRAVTDGTFTLAETEKENQFYFYRNDGGVLTDIDREPMDLYQSYIVNRMMMGEITEMVSCDIHLQISEDKKCIRLIISDIGAEINEEIEGKISEDDVKEIREEFDDLIVSSKKPTFIKRLLNKILG